MANGDSLPDAHHIVRVCPNSALDEEGWPQAPAFMLRSHLGEDYASVSWLEAFGEEKDQLTQIELAKVILNAKMPRMNPNAKLALLNVGEILKEVETHLPNYSLPILHNPTIRDEQIIDNSHAGIYNLPLDTDDHGVAEFVANVVTQVFPAKL